MTTGGRWSGSASRHSRQLAILRGAGHVFAEVGYDHAGMDAIALAAGVSKVTVYAHFHDKAGLFEALMEHWLSELPVPTFILGDDVGLREQLLEVVSELRRQAAHPAAQAIAQTRARSVLAPPLAHAQRWEQRHQPYQQHLEALLTRHCRCKQPALAARQFLTLILDSLQPSATGDTDETIAAIDAFVRAYPEQHSPA